jgi:hypothetical protein
VLLRSRARCDAKRNHAGDEGAPPRPITLSTPMDIPLPLLGWNNIIAGRRSSGGEQGQHGGGDVQTAMPARMVLTAGNTRRSAFWFGLSTMALSILRIWIVSAPPFCPELAGTGVNPFT